MKKKYKQKKKIITCFTGEPRSFTKGLISRIDFWNKSYIYKYDIESRYLISFSNENYDGNRFDISIKNNTIPSRTASYSCEG